MSSLVFEGDTWKSYEQLRQKDQKMPKNLCKILIFYLLTLDFNHFKFVTFIGFLP